ncbi:MAG: bifunctional hydroxymethylpyrimidine kinase/phosphomethylpyrimidine kinase [Burkholderiales bacterium]|nr:MAG: bifunctional hydroxymethylpyrimidine kinase/phosphomethylpyrimidine kinase [Burkholderiales bacterium]
MAIPNALSIAGIDPSGGAGIYADLKAFSALRAYGMGVVAALTAQNTRTVSGVHGVPPEFVRQQLDTLFDDVRVDSAKIGMLGTSAIARAVSDGLHGRVPSHLVVDPVMVAKSGDALLSPEATATLIELVLPLATVITPNLPEAGVLLRARAPDSLSEMRRAAEHLRRLLPDDGRRWVLLKGGHLAGSALADATDLLHDGDRMIELSAPRIDTRNTHGTGCTLSAAIAALLPQRADVEAAVREAKAYLTESIRRSGELSVGTGHGPVHHFHRFWNTPQAR